MPSFLDMQPGQVRVFDNVKAAELVRAFHSVFRKHEVEGAECEFWTYPTCRSEHEQVKRVWLLRSDGLSGTDIGEIRKRCLTEQAVQIEEFSGVRTFTVDGRTLNRDNEQTFKNRPRTTKHGWEFMNVGETRTVRMHLRDLREVLSNHVIRRQLDWVYRCDRDYESERELESKIAYWSVTRTA